MLILESVESHNVEKLTKLKPKGITRPKPALDKLPKPKANG